MKKFTRIAVVVLLLYCAAYGVARWRKFIVMREYDLKEESLLVRHTGFGWDVRDTPRSPRDWPELKGHLKNKINPYLVTFFRPLELIEDSIRGFKKPLPAPTTLQHD
jgi:hypothetical protein